MFYWTFEKVGKLLGESKTNKKEFLLLASLKMLIEKENILAKESTIRVKIILTTNDLS